jgi:hypothetical protein
MRIRIIGQRGTGTTGEAGLCACQARPLRQKLGWRSGVAMRLVRYDLFSVHDPFRAQPLLNADNNGSKKSSRGTIYRHCYRTQLGYQIVNWQVLSEIDPIKRCFAATDVSQATSRIQDFHAIGSFHQGFPLARAPRPANTNTADGTRLSLNHPPPPTCPVGAANVRSTRTAALPNGDSVGEFFRRRPYRPRGAHCWAGHPGRSTRLRSEPRRARREA